MLSSFGCEADANLEAVYVATQEQDASVQADPPGHAADADSQFLAPRLAVLIWHPISTVVQATQVEPVPVS